MRIMLTSEEHRYHKRLREYWDELRGSRPFPAEHEIDPERMAEMWPSCFLISIDDVTHRLGYRYSYLGEELIEAYGDDANYPDVVMRLVATSGSSMVRKFDEVVKQRLPVMDESHFVNLKHVTIHYRTCMLPLGYRENEVSHILGCMRWRSS